MWSIKRVMRLCVDIHMHISTKRQAKAELQNQHTEAEITSTPCLLPLELESRKYSEYELLG